jgi:hypothetical protein
MRILLLRGIAGIDERTRGLTHHWFDMVDLRSANVGSAQRWLAKQIGPRLPPGWGSVWFDKGCSDSTREVNYDTTNCRYGEAAAAAASWRAHDGRRQRGTACPHLYRYRLRHILLARSPAPYSPFRRRAHSPTAFSGPMARPPPSPPRPPPSHMHAGWMVSATKTPTSSAPSQDRGFSQSIAGRMEKLKSEVNQQHPARIWVEWQERESAAKDPRSLRALRRPR